MTRPRSLDEPQPGRADRRLGEGSSTTNSVRWAGNMCSLISTGRPGVVGRDPLAPQQRRADRAPEQRGVGGARRRRRRSSGSRPAAGRRAVRRTAAARRRRGTAAGRASAGHHTVTTANGSPSARLTRFTRSTWSTPSIRRTRSRRRDERELDDLPLGAGRCPQLVLDRAELLEALAHRLGGDEPPEPLPGGDQPVVTHQLEGPAHRHPAGAELRRQLGLARQHRPRRRSRARPSAHRRSPGSGCASSGSLGAIAHLYYSCLR